MKNCNIFMSIFFLFTTLSVNAQEIYNLTSRSCIANSGFGKIKESMNESSGEFEMRGVKCHFNLDSNIDNSASYYLNIKSITIKFSIRLLMGEPVVDGVFEWEADEINDKRFDFKHVLDYNDCVFVGFYFGKQLLYVKLSPTVPASGEGYGFNAPGSPNWNDLFYQLYGGEFHKLSDNPNYYEKNPKNIWKLSPRFTDFALGREKSLLKSVKSVENKSENDFWDTPENTTTTQQQTQEIKQKEAVERQKALNEQAKAKYNALKNPYSWNVTKNDTVFDAETQIIKNLNPYFNNGTITLSSVNKGKVIGTANNITTNLPLAEGWNTLRIALKGTNYNLKDSVKVYYKKDSRFGTFTDSRDGNVYKWVKIGNQVWMAENLRYKASSGCWAYDNNENNAKIYGYRYYWKTAMNICPSGWHLPSKEEWETLIETLGGNENSQKALKSIIGWRSGENGDNSSGFNALPLIIKSSDQIFDPSFWSSTKEDSEYSRSWYFKLYCKKINYTLSGLYTDHIEQYNYVRLIKNN